MVATAAIIDSVIIGSPLISLKDKSLPIFDPIKKSTLERMVLNTWRQRNVLVFYPADFSFVCPTELFKLNELYPKFISENAEVLVISRDSVLVHQHRVESEKHLKDFKIKMVSDREASLWRDIWLIHAKTWEYERVSMIVAPTWQIAYIEVSPSKIWRNIEELLRKIQALNHAIQHPEMMCPEAWKPGTDWIKASQLDSNKKQFTHD